MARHRRLPPPRAHWLLLCVVFSVIASLLALHAILGFHVNDAGADGPAGAVPAVVRGGGAVIDASHDPPATVRPKDHTLALTFDDGPDPTWTPAVLDVLDHYHVKATFFVIGSHAAQHPGLVREIVARGNEIGDHTATHVDLRGVGPVRTSLELRGTDLVLAAATGRSTTLVRPPYSSQPSAVDDAALLVSKRISAEGQLTVLSDVDSQDWRRPGVDQIVANATPPDSRGAVVMMHDSGGDREQTVEALNRLIPALQAQGWRLDTVSATTGIPAANIPATPLSRVGGWLLVSAVQLGDFLASALTILLVSATALAGARALLVLSTASIHLRRHRARSTRLVGAPTTVLIPAYNEELGIETTVRSALASDHPVEVIVIDDGSTDHTAEIVHRLRLPRVRLLRQPNRGKAAALNAGIAAARTDLVVLVDGDTVVERSTVRRLVRNFADPAVGAVSGNAKVGNRRSLLGKLQHIEYVVGFNLDRRMFDVLECMPTVPGAVGAFRRHAVERLGGIPGDTLAEDTDLTMALQRAGWRVVHEQDARAWTEAPATFTQLWKQRYRWCYGTMQAVWKHRAAVLQSGAAGRLGRRGLPYLLLFQVVLPVLAPFADAAAVSGALSGDWANMLLFWLAFLALQLVPSLLAFRLDRECLRPLLVLPLQQVLYRQLMYLVVIQSLMTAVTGARLPWHKLHRTGALARPTAVR
jgi:cellulose synthase/poly-beta-1,6-N-acetylglucosamine synthase-like glycosyltransferase/peptidoglycan/xylan/chitin deacetylase (PgdA/CDA1 family)